MNKKGFTLVELIATIVLLSLVLGISSYSITQIIKNSKQKNYNLLLENIRNASEVYYQECKYGSNTNIECSDNNVVTLGDLVKYGYLKGNSKKNNEYNLVNPLNDKDISQCKIRIKYNNGSLTITSFTVGGGCPTKYTQGIADSSWPSLNSHFSRSGSGIEIEPVNPGDDVINPGDPIIPVVPKDEAVY